MRRGAFLVLAALLCASCASYGPVRVPTDDLPAAIRAGVVLGPGDLARMETAGGAEIEMEVLAVGEREIRGRSPSGAPVSVPIDDVAGVEVRQIDPTRSIAAAAGGYAALAILAATIVFIQFVSGL